MTLRLFFAVLLTLVSACDGSPDPIDGGPRGDSATVDSGPVLAPSCVGLVAGPPTPTCEPLATDYPGGAWPACVSDGGEYQPIDPDISTIPRVLAYEQIASLIFDATRTASADEFLQARLIYQESEGLDSRVVRRYDPHFTVPDGTDCTVDGTPAAYPDYCVGPARLQPAILDAFEIGIRGSGDARAAAATIEASLLWFLYVSPYKESLTCTRTAKDCDSAYAYYTGGAPRTGGLGLAALVQSVDPAAHERAWDGLLAVRCWRDLDPAAVATDTALRERAREQYDRALIDGVAAIVRDRLVRTCTVDGPERNYHWTLARTLGAALDREASARDAAMAAVLREELGRASIADADVARAVAALDALFACP